MPYMYSDLLESRRIRTVFLTELDIPNWVPFFESEEAIRFLGVKELGLKSTQEMSHHMIQKQLNRYKNHAFGLQKLLLKDSGTFIGLAGLLLQEIEGEKVVEIGYHLLPDYWGNGYATEAAALFESFAFHTLKLGSVISMIDVENYRSIRVAQRNDFYLLKKTKGVFDEPVLIYQKDHLNTLS